MSASPTPTPSAAGQSFFLVSDYTGTYKIGLATVGSTKVSSITLSGRIMVSPSKTRFFQATSNNNVTSEVSSIDGATLSATIAGGVVGWKDDQTILWIPKVHTYSTGPLLRSNIDGSATASVATDESLGFYSASRYFQSPDGKKAVLLADGPKVVVVNLETGATVSTSGENLMTNPIWTTDNRIVWVKGGNLFHTDPSLTSVQSVTVGKTLKAVMPGPHASQLLASSESTGAGGSRITSYHLLNTDGTNLVDLAGTFRGSIFENCFLTPDGTRLIYIYGTKVYNSLLDGTDEKLMAEGFLGGIQSGAF